MNLATPDRIRSLQRKLYRKAKADGSFAVCPTVKPVGKPDAGNRHVRFDERGRETGRCRTAQATAPFLDSTRETGLDCTPKARRIAEHVPIQFMRRAPHAGQTPSHVESCG